MLAGTRRLRRQTLAVHRYTAPAAAASSVVIELVQPRVPGTRTRVDQLADVANSVGGINIIIIQFSTTPHYRRRGLSNTCQTKMH